MEYQPGPLYQRIYALVRLIPPGKVTTYGRVARMVGGCSAQMVGFALAALKEGSDVPWQRVINAQGKISLSRGGWQEKQRRLLEAEGVEFDPRDRVDLARFGWPGPPADWLRERGLIVPPEDDNLRQGSLF
jgi:methylated-DNA-protein-cysteine methyltransferase-like protein